MASQLNSMLQGNVPCRRMRHTVAELHKQLMGEARLALRKNKGSMMFS